MSLKRHLTLLLAALVVAVCAALAGMLAWPGRTAEAEGPTTFRLPAEHGRTAVPDVLDIAEPAPGNAPLLLFLPATGAVPEQYKRFLDTAHAAGFSVLGLAYPNTGPSLARSCEADMACYGDMLANRFDGARPSRFSSVSANDAILRRLQDSLAYLAEHDPAGRWERYRNGSAVRWNRLVVAGHSQGGGEAAYIAHLHRVRGALLFSAPAQALDEHTADWLSMHCATPTTRVWALDDVHDVYAARISPTWRALGISAGVPRLLPTGAHGLLTTLPLGTSGQAHNRVVNDETPLDAGGRPVLEPVWRWMLGRAKA